MPLSELKAIEILLVEDDPADARLLQEGLREMIDARPVWTCVCSLGEARARLQSQGFDVILLDLNLPDSQGLDTFFELRATVPEIPILLLTGLDDQGLALEAVRAGAQDYLVKGDLAINSLARAIRYAIERQRLQTELHNLSLHDSLTGLYNRRGFFMLAEEQLRLVPRSSQGLLLFLCDLDGMKSINDSFGHLEGDRALIDMSDILRLTVRSSDIIARLSGDEFVILAVGTLPATAELLQARMQSNLNAHNARSGHPYELSFSVGVVHAAPEQPASMEELISKADQEMYAHKRARQKARGS